MKKKIVNQGIKAMRWLTGTDEEFPEIKLFAENYIRHANRNAQFHPKENQVEIRFGYVEETNGRVFHLEITIGEHILYSGHYGTMRKTKKEQKVAFEKLREKAIMDIFARGIEYTLIVNKLRYP